MAAIRNVKVAISSDFMNAFAAIPKNMQGKVLEFVTRFKNDPTASSINYEKIAQFKDPTLRSVRIDKAYRGIVKKPETGSVPRQALTVEKVQATFPPASRFPNYTEIRMKTELFHNQGQGQI